MLPAYFQWKAGTPQTGALVSTQDGRIGNARFIALYESAFIVSAPHVKIK
jgi:hypothetical protein